MNRSMNKSVNGSLPLLWRAGSRHEPALCSVAAAAAASAAVAAVAAAVAGRRITAAAHSRTTAAPGWSSKAAAAAPGWLLTAVAAVAECSCCSQCPAEQLREGLEQNKKILNKAFLYENLKSKKKLRHIFY